MFGKPIHLFRMFGFDVGIDVSWFILFMLITWSLAMGLFPVRYPGLSFGAYFITGMVGALGLFLSIVLHELAHSLVARKFDLHMKGITLFLFGGVSEMPEEPRRPGEEFWMAIAGPLSSLALAALFYGLYALGLSLGWIGIGNGVVGYLAVINVVLALFNMVPAFPLDGGRVLRSAFWRRTGDYAKATRIASSVGSTFGLFLFIFGAVRTFAGNPVGGVWWMLIGLFIRTGAKATAVQANLARILRGESVRAFMSRQPVVVPPDIPLNSLVEEYLYKYDYKLFPVGDGGRVMGCIGADKVKALAPGQREALRAADIMGACPAEAMIPAEASAEQALKRMQESGQPTLMVIEDGRIAGVVATADILRFLSLRMELEKSARHAGGTPVGGTSAGGAPRVLPFRRPKGPDAGRPLPA